MGGIKIYTAGEAEQDKSELNQKITDVAQTAEEASLAVSGNTADLQAQAGQIEGIVATQNQFKKFYSGTSTQTVTNKTQVIIPHGIPDNAPTPAIGRTVTLNAVSEAASGYRTAMVDATNITVEYDVAIVSGTNGWVMDWML